MPQDNLQVNSQEPQDNPDETAAVLSFATKLSEQLLPKAPQSDEEKGATSDLEQKDGVDTTKEGKESKMGMKKEMDKMKKEMKAMINKEMAELKETINEALLEEEDNDDDEE